MARRPRARGANAPLHALERCPLRGYVAEPFRRDEIVFLLAVDAGGATLRGRSGRQPLSAGFIGGTTLTNGFFPKNGFDGLTSRLAGVALDYRFNDRWSAEADVLYLPSDPGS